jgi:hypothetical protein
VDADTVTGHVATSLGMDAAPTVIDAWRDELDGDPALTFEEQASVHSSGMRVLPLSAHPLNTELLEPHRVAGAIAVARRSFDFVVVDLHPSYSPLNRAVFDRGDRILVPVTPDLPAIRATVKLREIADELGMRDRLALIVNRAGTGVRSEDVERTVGIPTSVTSARAACSGQGEQRGRTLFELAPREDHQTSSRCRTASSASPSRSGAPAAHPVPPPARAVLTPPRRAPRRPGRPRLVRPPRRLRRPRLDQPSDRTTSTIEVRSSTQAAASATSARPAWIHAQGPRRRKIAACRPPRRPRVVVDAVADVGDLDRCRLSRSATAEERRVRFSTPSPSLDASRSRSTPSRGTAPHSAAAGCPRRRRGSPPPARRAQRVEASGRSSRRRSSAGPRRPVGGVPRAGRCPAGTAPAARDGRRRGR